MLLLYSCPHCILWKVPSDSAFYIFHLHVFTVVYIVVLFYNCVILWLLLIREIKFYSVLFSVAALTFKTFGPAKHTKRYFVVGLPFMQRKLVSSVSSSDSFRTHSLLESLSISPTSSLFWNRNLFDMVLRRRKVFLFKIELHASGVQLLAFFLRSVWNALIFWRLFEVLHFHQSYLYYESSPWKNIKQKHGRWRKMDKCVNALNYQKGIWSNFLHASNAVPKEAFFQGVMNFIRGIPGCEKLTEKDLCSKEVVVRVYAGMIF